MTIFSLEAPVQEVLMEKFSHRAKPACLPRFTPRKIANIFGALYHFPLNDCLMIDFGTQALHFDLISKEGLLQEGFLFPSFQPLTSWIAPSPQQCEAQKRPSILSSLGPIYFGILGVLERLIAEVRQIHMISPSSVKTVAIGRLTHTVDFREDLLEFMDDVDPNLTLIGINQILKETRS